MPPLAPSFGFALDLRHNGRAVKEQILHLDPHDDFVSARDKMGWVQTQRVLLVWPRRVPSNGAPPLRRRLDLLLLHRHAHRLGAQLALVTQDETVRDHAAELGLPVFDSVEATRTMRWRSRMPRIRPTRRGARPNPAAIRAQLRPAPTLALSTLPAGVRLAARVVLFLLGLAGVFALLFAVVPSATVSLDLAPQPLTTTTDLAADPEATGVQGATVPARPVRVIVQNTRLLPTSGQVEVPGERASGQVVFSNIAGTPALIPQGTSVRVGGSVAGGANVRFITQQAASIEGRIGATIQVDVQAVEPGLTGNVPANAINTIDGPLGTQLAVVNVQPTSGGTVERRSAVAAADRDRLRAELFAELQQSSFAAISAQLQPGEFVVSETVRARQVLAEDYDPPLGAPSDVLSLTLRIEAAGTAVNDADLRAVALTALETKLPAGASLAPATVRVARNPDVAVDEAGRIRFSVTAVGDTTPALDRETVRAAISGRSLDEARALLQGTLPLAASPEFVLRPAWLAQWYPVLPWLPLRIDVIAR